MFVNIFIVIADVTGTIGCLPTNPASSEVEIRVMFDIGVRIWGGVDTAYWARKRKYQLREFML